MRVDAHLHLWRLARADYGWITEDLPALRRDFEPDDAKAELDRARVDGAVVVQAAPTVEETVFLLDHARRHPWILGVVGWVDLEAPEAPERIRALARDPKLKGIRPMIQDIAEPAWMLKPELTPALQALEALDLVFDALVTPRHLTSLRKFLEAYPGLRVVIDHGAKPAIENGGFEPWATQMREIAGSTAVRCKLSGLVTEAGARWTTGQLRPYVDHLLEVFGSDRLIFGSDWPVVTLVSDYQTWLRAAGDLLAGLEPEARTQVFGDNAIGFYGLAGTG